jgi:hypothetical protein
MPKNESTSINNTVFWDMTPSSLVAKYQCSEGTRCVESLLTIYQATVTFYKAISSLSASRDPEISQPPNTVLKYRGTNNTSTLCAMLVANM